jgi:hypothetical protein
MRERLIALLVRTFGPRAMRGACRDEGARWRSTAERTGAYEPSGAGGEHRHRGVESGGNLRAAVFGVNDGLISNASLILGVAGASADNAIILLSGAAGLMAGAFSMAAGEYVSVRSQREMYEYQIGLERDELEHYPEAEAEELALIYQARGLEEPKPYRWPRESSLTRRRHWRRSRAKARLEPGGARQPVGSGRVFVPIVCDRRVDSTAALLVHRRRSRAHDIGCRNRNCFVRGRCVPELVHRARCGA